MCIDIHYTWLFQKNSIIHCDAFWKTEAYSDFRMTSREKSASQIVFLNNNFMNNLIVQVETLNSPCWSYENGNTPRKRLFDVRILIEVH